MHEAAPLWRKRTLLLTLLFLTYVPMMFAGPKSGSGINASDTWVTMNITITASMSATLPNAMYSVSGSKYVTTAAYNLTAKHYYVEAGFDSNDLLVINIEPTDAPTDPTTTFYSGVGKITVHGDRLFLYDASNNPIPVVMPDNAPIPLLSLLGLSPGPSVLKSLITTSPPAVAIAIPGTLSYPQSNLAQILSTDSGGTSRTKTLTYSQSGSNWILQTVVHTMSTTSHNMTATAQLASVSWSDNSTGDARRARKGSSLARYPETGTKALSSYTVPGPSTVTPSDQTTTGATGANVVFQHGIFSSGGTWSRMVPWLQSDFNFAQVQTPSLRNTDPIATQSSSLISLVQASGVSNNLVIGHSQGGLIARTVAQNNSSLFYGVAQLDSPNTGALILYNGAQDIDYALVYEFDNLLADAGCLGFTDNPACYLAYIGGDIGIPFAVSYGFDTAWPATTDLQIGSAYLNGLNAVTETFPRVGISGHSDKRWVFFRFVGDSFCNPDDDTCGGRVVADYAEYTYDYFAALWVYYTFFCDPSQYDCQDAADQTAAVLSDMDGFDQFWNDLTAGSDDTDAIVQGASQTYPRATQNYVISGADSHAGATRSPLDRAVLDTALSQQFLTPPTGCSYTVTASPTSFSFYGGQITITVTGSSSNATTCSGSTVSNALWMEAWGSPLPTFGPKGPFTLTWLADINLGQDTRTGTLTVAGNTIQITQTGVSGTVGIGSVALSGYLPYCQHTGHNYCPPNETVSVVVNGATISTNTVPGWSGIPINDNLNNLSSLVVSTINNDTSSPVYAGIVGPVVYLVSKSQVGGNYPYSASVNCSGTCYVSVATAGASMTGSQ